MAKIGEGHLAAMGRLGLKELRNAVNPSRESVADSELGLLGAKTQGEIAQGRKGPGAGPEQEDKVVSLEQMKQEAAKQREQGQERQRQQERGMER